ncbi:MAG: PepSY-associated TM helix domain-containing protein [Sporichthyaceae bacterium]
MAIDVQTRPDASFEAEPPRPTRRAVLEPVLRRLHFLSGFLAAPIVVALSISGILFAWNPQIERAIHTDALTAVSEGPARPLSEQVRAAQAAKPEWKVTAVTPAAPGVFDGKETTAVAMIPPGAVSPGGFGHAAGAVSVYVDPGSAQVLGEIDEQERPSQWLRTLHSSFRLGENVAPLTELAASWLIVSLITGLYLRWPVMRRKLGAALVPKLRTPGWSRAQAFHTTLGLWLVIPLIALIVTGLTWTKFAGSRIDDLEASVSRPAPFASTLLPGQAPPPPVAADPHAEHGGSAAPAAPSAPPFSQADIAGQIDTVAAGTAAAGVTGLVKFTPPKTIDKGWKADKADATFPNRPVNLAVDGRDGTVLDRVEWDERPVFSKLSTMGVSFHQAQLFGLWTQVYMTILALGVIVLVVAGYRMWWLRRPPSGFGFPPKAGPLWRTVPVPLLLLFAGLIYVMPTLGISFLIYLVLERLARALRRPKAAARA